MIPNINSPNIPNVGMPLKAYCGNIFAFAKCLCDESNEPFMIRGHDQIVGCGKCKRMYQILKVEYDINVQGKFGPNITIGHVGFLPNLPALKPELVAGK